jgi:type I restriction enzyme, S subunit
MLIGLPSQTDQAWFVRQVEPIQSLIENNRRRVTNLRSTRDLLLPKLISGQLDVEHLDIEVGEPVTA